MTTSKHIYQGAGSKTGDAFDSFNIKKILLLEEVYDRELAANRIRMAAYTLNKGY